MDIARICHTLPRTAEVFVRHQLDHDPSLLDTRLCRCLEPSLPVFRAEDTVRGWDGNRISLAPAVEPRPPTNALIDRLMEAAVPGSFPGQIYSQDHRRA